MKSKSYAGLYIFLAVLALAALVVSFLEGPKAIEENVKADDEMQSLAVLNQAVFSLARVIGQQDRLAVETEYAYLNDIFYAAWPESPALKEMADEIVTGLEKFRLDETERQLISAASRQNLEKKIIASIMPEKAENQPLGLHLSRLMADLALSRAPFYNYQVSKPEQNLKLGGQAFAALENLASKTVDACAELLNQAKASSGSGPLRAQFRHLIETLKISNPEQRHQALVAAEEYFGFGPAYWQARGAAALEAGANLQDRAMYADELALCLEKYESFGSISNRDSLYAGLLMMDLSHNVFSADETRLRLGKIIDHGRGLPTQNMFAALVTMREKLYDDAVKHIEASITQNQFSAASRVILSEILSAGNDRPGLWRFLEAALADPQVGNQEILYYLSKVSDPFALGKFRPRIEEFKLSADPGLGENTLILTVPASWPLDGISEAGSALIIGGEKIQASGFGLVEGGGGINIFFDVPPEAKSGLNGNLSFELKTVFFPINLKGRLRADGDPFWKSWPQTEDLEDLDQAKPTPRALIAEAVEDLGLTVKTRPSAQPQAEARPEPAPQEKHASFSVEEISTIGSCWRLDNDELRPCGGL